jgi:hypothetical protein
LNAKLKETLLFFQGMSGKMALAVSLAVAGFVMIAENSECIHAQAICQVGSDPTFTQPIKITGTGSNTATLSAANLTASRTLTFPDADGALLAGTLTNNAPFISVSALGALDSSSTLTASTPLKSTALGQITAADLVPENDLTVGSGTANQILSVDGTGTALVFRNETTPSYTANAPYIKVDAAGAADTSSTLTANSPCLKADASGQIEACPSLTNSTPLKASATGQIEASDLDPVNDLTNGTGTALQQLRVNSAANSLEFFTPSSSGGRWTLVGQGQMSQSSYTMGACWYDDTQGTGIGGGLDQTKVYKFVVEPTGSMGTMGNNGSYPAMVAMNETNCSNIASSGNYLFSSSVTNNGFWVVDTQGWHASFNSYVNAPWLGYQQHTTSNSSSSKCGGASITMIIRNGIGNVSVQNTKNEGVKFTDIKSAAPCYDSGNNLTGWQQADSSGITWDSSQSYAASPVDNMNQMTGIQFKRYDGGGSFSQPVWYLYESDY